MRGDLPRPWPPIVVFALLGSHTTSVARGQWVLVEEEIPLPVNLAAFSWVC
jgi:hypothetical protein